MLPWRFSDNIRFNFALPLHFNIKAWFHACWPFVVIVCFFCVAANGHHVIVFLSVSCCSHVSGGLALEQILEAELFFRGPVDGESPTRMRRGDKFPCGRTNGSVSRNKEVSMCCCDWRHEIRSCHDWMSKELLSLRCFFLQLPLAPAGATFWLRTAHISTHVIKPPGRARRTSADHLFCQPAWWRPSTTALRLCALIVLYVNVWWGLTADRLRALQNEERLEHSGLIFRPAICQDYEN